MNSRLWFSLKKEAQYRYCRQYSKTKSRSVTNFGSKKSVPSKPNNQKYVYSSSMYNCSFPFKKCLAYYAIGSRNSRIKFFFHLLKDDIINMKWCFVLPQCRIP